MKLSLTKEEVTTIIKNLALENFDIIRSELDFSVAGAEYLDYNSLDKMNFIMSLEFKFSIVMSEADAYCMNNLQEVIDYVYEKLK
jgi:acyl carrier protein